MAHSVSVKVPFTKANVTRCLCPDCTVQAKSSCAKEKLSKLSDAFKKTPLAAADFPGVYCSAGTATCQDIDTTRSCICGGCAVYVGHKLGAGEPGGKFCKAGAAR